MTMRKKLGAFLLCMFVSFVFAGPLFAQEASEENAEAQTDGARAYLTGDAPIKIELEFFFGAPIHWWGKLADEGITGNDPELGGDVNEQIEFLALIGYSAMSLLSGSQLGLNVGALYPVFVNPTEDGNGTSELYAGIAIANGASLGSLLNLSFHTTLRYGGTGTDDEGKETYGYIQPFLGYSLIARDLAGLMVYSHKTLGNAAAVDDDYVKAGLEPAKPEAGHYFDIGCRFSFSKGTYYELQYSHPVSDYGVHHLKISYGGILGKWGI